MGKKEKPKFLDYLNAVKKADREREIAQHGKLISTRPLRIVKSKKVYDRKRDKRDCSKYNDGSLFFLWPSDRHQTKDEKLFYLCFARRQNAAAYNYLKMFAL